MIMSSNYHIFGSIVLIYDLPLSQQNTSVNDLKHLNSKNHDDVYYIH